MVLLNDRSREIQQHALDLAKHGVPDQEAVKSITTLVGRHTYDLRIAAQALRRADRRREFADDNRAHRLLQAAINGAPVSEPSDDDAALLNMLAQFRARPLAEQYRALAAAQPSLGQLADELEAGGWTMPRKDPSGGAPLTRAQRQQVEQTVAVFKRLRDLVGPQANTDDPLLRSGTAAAAAHEYLTEAAQRRA
jgi:hypothetical protein